MAENILKLRVESQEYDAKLKRAAQGLQQYADQCRKVGGTLEYVEKDTLDFVKAIGNMETVTKSAKGSLGEMTAAFTQFKMIYKQMSEAERQSPIGKALAESLDTLKGRISQTKKDLQDINQELNGSKLGQFGSILDGIGQKMGINANITELLTSKTALMTAGIGAATAVIGKATQEWAKYNAELAKQDQITTVTTGLKGAGADRMTDQARALVDTYNVDFREAINAANTLMTQFGKSGEEAMSLIRDGMRGMISGDGGKLLSMIQQYAPSFRDAGIEAAQLVAIIQNSEGGIFTDQNMNAIMMGIKNIRLMTDATSEALARLGIDGEEMTQKLNDGSMTIFEAMQKVSTAINGAGSASQAVGKVMQQVFGRQGTAAGTKLGEAIATLNTNLEETKRQTGELGDAYDDLYEANVKLNGAIRDCFEYDGWDQMATGIKAKLVSTLASVLDYLGKIKGALGGFSVTQQQGDTRNGGGAFIDRAIARLGDGKSQGQKTIYQKQIGAYANQIFNINDQITELQRKAGEDMDGNMAVNYEKQIRNLEARKEAIKRNMDEYDRRAQAVFAGTVTPPTKITPIKQTNQTNQTNNTKRKNKTSEVQKHELASVDVESLMLGELAPKPIPITFDVDTTGLNPLQIMEAELENLKEQQEIFGGVSSEVWQHYQELIKEAQNRIKEFKGESKSTTDNLDKGAQDSAKSFQIAAGAITSVGNALAGIDDPAAKIMSIIAQAIANVAAGAAKAVSAKDTTASGWAWIGAAAAITASMVAMISQIHSATGFAQGGVVPSKGYAEGGVIPGGIVIPGNHYSNDMQWARVNAGETILTRAQAGNLASQLEGGGLQNLRLSATVTGEQIRLVLNNNGRRTGRGEYVTTNFQRG